MGEEPSPVPVPAAVTQDDPIEALVRSLKPAERRSHINACLDEYEACAEHVRRLGKSVSKDALKACKAWGERQKRILRLLGYRHRMSVIGGARFDVGDNGPGFFDEDEGLTPPPDNATMGATSEKTP